ncbi:uncharacterized protein [Dermacentor andersoni]|uniref:uncharacterized protein isoform X3 n=1 Tax=Dermacentor andersoni TaxID=34620 RepID=UPI002416B061|nr:uncharacterized protein LOC126539924 isoform X3 [Dermacentor andersoni]
MTDNSYAVQHFGFSPKSIVDDVYSIWFDYTQKCLDDLKTTLQDKEFMQSNITHVPSHVLLPEDDVHRQLPDERRPSVSSLRAQLGSLHRRIAQETARQQALKEELALQDVLREQLRAKLRSIEEVAQQAAEMSNKTTMVPAEGVARLHLDTQDVPGLCRKAEGLSGATNAAI